MLLLLITESPVFQKLRGRHWGRGPLTWVPFSWDPFPQGPLPWGPFPLDLPPVGPSPLCPLPTGTTSHGVSLPLCAMPMGTSYLWVPFPWGALAYVPFPQLPLPMGVPLPECPSCWGSLPLVPRPPGFPSPLVAPPVGPPPHVLLMAWLWLMTLRFTLSVILVSKEQKVLLPLNGICTLKLKQMELSADVTAMTPDICCNMESCGSLEGQ